jgi:signal transduction histidine kinase
VYAVHQSADGAVWAGTLSGGVSELRNGRFITYTTADGLASNTVTSIAESADGTMWFATPNGLSSLSKSNWRTYKARDGLPSDDQNCLYEDSHGVLWAGTSAGLAFLRSGNVETLGEIRESLHEPILGIAEDKSGWLWISTSNHVLRVERDKLLEGVLSGADLREYSLADGLHGTEGVKRQQSVVADPRGRIWFSMNHGISVVDPVRAVRTAAPALVHVESVSADGTSIDLREPIRFPAARQRITISYEGLNLSAPERVSYRYRLEGFDHGWSEPVSAREAIYTNLSPGVYHFRVMASNSDGLWNDNPASVEFRMLPAYYQTAWFYFLCLVAAGGIGWASYQWRIQQMKARLDMQFEERLSERTRIAGELHDTLLQSFQGLTLHFQKVRNLLPERPAEAIQTLDRALNGAEQAIVEGREAILDIRSPAASENDLAQQIGSLGEELTAGFSNGESTKFRVLIEGASQTLHPFLQVEIYRIAREALRNAFGHAEAREIEAEITYGKKLFRLRIRDDGKGIDPDILHQGQRAGHLGLPGMRERAKRIGGKLDMWSEPRAGTEMELSIPSSIAYRPSDTRSGVQPFGKKNRADHDRKL